MALTKSALAEVTGKLELGRSTTTADAFRAMPNVRVYRQSFAAAIGLAEQVMSTLGMSPEIVEQNISAMRRHLDSGNVAGSPSS